MNDKEFLTVAEAAKEIGVGAREIYRWIENKKINARYFIPASVVNRIAKERTTKEATPNLWMLAEEHKEAQVRKEALAQISELENKLAELRKKLA